MLVDELIASPNLNFLGKGQSDFIRDLKLAHRFDLDGAFAAAADELGTSRPSAFERAITLCRPPYDYAWFETSQVNRKRFKEPSRDGEQPIKRIGILMQGIQQDEGTGRWLSRWVGTLAWSFLDGSVNTCGMSMLFDCGAPPHFPEFGMSMLMKQAEAKTKVVAVGQKWSDDQSEVPALARVSNRTLPVPCPYFEKLLANYEKENGSKAVDKFLARQMDNWSAEQPFWLGVLALLNSRNASSVNPGPDLTKINKSRVKKGRAELLKFSTCTISPRIKARIAAESRSSETSSVRAHFVRGHFKIRSSGVFWWSPFLRGDKRMGFADKDYSVVGGAAK